MTTAVILAGGPSLTSGIGTADVDHCRGRADVLAINNAWHLAPWARWMYACDRLWWERYRLEVVDAFAGERWTSVGDDEEPRHHEGVRIMRSLEAPGLCRTPGTIHQGKNGGFQAINLAFHFGVRRMILLGYDMQGSGHWHGAHPDGFAQFNADECLPHFDQLAADLKAEGVEVINCTRSTALRAFPCAPLREVLP